MLDFIIELSESLDLLSKINIFKINELTHF